MDVFSQFTPELEVVWNTALQHESKQWPFYTKAWHTQWLASLGAGEQPMIVADVPSNILIPLSVKNGSAHFSGGEEIADYLDAIGPEAAKAAMWQKTLGIISMQGAKQLLLRNISEDSSTLLYFSTVNGATIEKEDSTPIANLPSTFDEYQASLDRKNRHELKRKMRKFESIHTDIAVSTQNNIDLLIKFMKRDADKKLFLTDSMIQFFQNLPDILTNTFTQFTLSVNGNAIATAIAFRIHSSLLLYNSGYNDDYVGAGFYLKTKMIEWAISQNIHSFNFLQGNERYKYELGGKDFFVYKITLQLS